MSASVTKLHIMPLYMRAAQTGNPGGERTRALNAVITMLNTRAVIRLLPFEFPLPPPPKKSGLSLI